MKRTAILVPTRKLRIHGSVRLHKVSVFDVFHVFCYNVHGS